MVLEGRLELPWVAPPAPQAGASAISPPEHIIGERADTLHLFPENASLFLKKSRFFSRISGKVLPARQFCRV